MAEITWLGHACFRLKSKEATIIADPYDKSLGIGSVGQRADIVTVSHDHPHHNAVSAVKGEPFVISSPGEFEVRGVFVTGVWSFADDKGGKEQGRNNIFLFHLDDLSVCHLGSLGHTLNSRQVEALGSIDVLLVPLGGQAALPAAKVSEVISQLEPRVVVPMHYPANGDAATHLEPFMKEMGLKEWTTQDKLALKAADLGETTQVMVLEAKAG